MTSLLSVSGPHHDRFHLALASSDPVPATIQFVNWRDRGADWHFALMPVGTGRTRSDGYERRKAMPLVDIELIEGVFDEDQKQRMIRDVTEAMIGVEGEAMRGVTWVRVQEIASGEWAIGGKPITAEAIKAAQSERA